MPYIDPEERYKIEHHIKQAAEHIITPGMLNFAITRLLVEYILSRGVKLRYGLCNELIGVLECVKQELYRRVVSPYEDAKKEENGDVF